MFSEQEVPVPNQSLDELTYTTAPQSPKVEYRNVWSNTPSISIPRRSTMQCCYSYPASAIYRPPEYIVQREPLSEATVMQTNSGHNMSLPNLTHVNYVQHIVQNVPPAPLLQPMPTQYVQYSNLENPYIQYLAKPSTYVQYVAPTPFYPYTPPKTE